MLGEIDVVTKSLQTRDHTLCACREDLDTFISTIAEQIDKVNSALYRCMLGT